MVPVTKNIINGVGTLIDAYVAASSNGATVIDGNDGAGTNGNSTSGGGGNGQQMKQVLEHLHNLAPGTFPSMREHSTNEFLRTSSSSPSVMDAVTYMRVASLEMLNLHDRDIPACLRDLYKHFLQYNQLEQCKCMSVVFTMMHQSKTRLLFHKDMAQLASGLITARVPNLLPLNRGVRAVQISIYDIFNDMTYRTQQKDGNFMSVGAVASQPENPYLRMLRSIILESIREFAGNNDKRLFRETQTYDETDKSLMLEYTRVHFGREHNNANINNGESAMKSRENVNDVATTSSTMVSARDDGLHLLSYVNNGRDKTKLSDPLARTSTATSNSTVVAKENYFKEDAAGMSTSDVRRDAFAGEAAVRGNIDVVDVVNDELFDKEKLSSEENRVARDSVEIANNVVNNENLDDTYRESEAIVANNRLISTILENATTDSVTIIPTTSQSSLLSSSLTTQTVRPEVNDDDDDDEVDAKHDRTAANTVATPVAALDFDRQKISRSPFEVERTVVEEEQRRRETLSSLGRVSSRDSVHIGVENAWNSVKGFAPVLASVSARPFVAGHQSVVATRSVSEELSRVETTRFDDEPSASSLSASLRQSTTTMSPSKRSVAAKPKRKRRRVAYGAVDSEFIAKESFGGTMRPNGLQRLVEEPPSKRDKRIDSVNLDNLERYVFETDNESPRRDNDEITVIDDNVEVDDDDDVVVEDDEAIDAIDDREDEFSFEENDDDNGGESSREEDDEA